MEGKEGRAERGSWSFGFFFQCQPHLSFSAIVRPQITASIPQPIFPFLLPNKFHWVNMLLFFLLKESLHYSPPFSSQLLRAVFLSDERPKWEIHRTTFSGCLFKVEESVTFSYTNCMPLTTVLCTRMRESWGPVAVHQKPQRLKIPREDYKEGSWRSMQENLKKKNRDNFGYAVELLVNYLNWSSELSEVCPLLISTAVTCSLWIMLRKFNLKLNYTSF